MIREELRWRSSRRTLALPHPQTQLDKYQINLNIQVINLRPDRTTYTTREREEPTSWKVEGAEHNSGEKQITEL